LERVRILNGSKKDKARLANEVTQKRSEPFFADFDEPNGGFRLRNDNGKRWVIPGY